MLAKRLLLLSAMAVTIGFTSCQDKEDITRNDAVSELTLSQISKLGFSNKNVLKVENGYIVEGDILLTDSDLKDAGKVQALRVGESEQYRTTNLVKGLPRVITVATDPSLPRTYAQALDIVVQRYNAEGLQLTFKRVTSGADITMKKAPATATYLASAGFPTAAGNPFNSVTVNSRYMGVNPDANYLATILAHEIGHCIGFRHTDYMDRSYSCGGDVANEGPSIYGAILIPGTPAAADPNSWMLACIGTGDDRPFNANDKTALDYLY
ncbi:M57 family metalloprotease [Pontibacter arcticus]|uniref:Protease n=1 Tax=Pontibacter arcticus TaxID=2080288 RepID=A0A364RCQ2_9BACT|nr:M57 family metalloprotease [Pontibacter arcticus]RAU82072.1 protease [Pontibacter arcticus]